MGSIFVWTFHDVFGLVFLGVALAIGLVAIICSVVHSWWRKITRRKKNKVGIPSTSTNTQSAAIAQIATELEDGVRIANIGGVPSAEQLSKWARQLRAL